MVAGNILVSGRFRNEINEHALGAGVRALRVAEIHAGDGVLERGGRLLRGVHGAAVTALLEEIEFELEDFENVAIVTGHGSTSADLKRLSPAVNRQAVTHLTINCDEWPF
jgi:hypothetical protein